MNVSSFESPVRLPLGGEVWQSCPNVMFSGKATSVFIHFIKYSQINIWDIHNFNIYVGPK